MKQPYFHSSIGFRFRHSLFTALFAVIAMPWRSGAVESTDAILPAGVKAVWDASKAFHETTTTCERICLNGLWQWQPAEPKSEQVPAADWGYFKVPGSWPGITDYLQKDSQTLFAHPSWKQQKPGEVIAAWHQREITVPANWTNRRITAHFEYVNSLATVYVDGQRAGEITFPAGEVDLTALCPPGSMHRLTVLVVALPLKGVLLSYTDSASAREVKGSVPRRGLCGDVYLVSTPAAARITNVKVDTSFRKQELAASVALDNLAANARYVLQGRVTKDGVTVRDFKSRAFQAGDLTEGRFAVTNHWLPDQLWDTHTPQNTYILEVSLLNEALQALDTTWPERFGFREFWIQGKDFYLNGTRIFLSAVPIDNASIGVAQANYAAARESMERLKSFGINYVYTHNYDCEPGSHLSFTELLRAADDVGMLIGFTQPHFSHYDWKSPEADRTNGYARHAAFYVQVAQNHPAVILYSMSHNATGYSEDMNPDLIDGAHDPRDQWSQRNVKLALRAEAIVKHLDPSRIVYHHAGGNIGAMHTINFYPNFVPVQELSDWFGHWSQAGVKPAFTCEFGAPFTWDWTMYRGWYKGKREFGSAPVPWEYCVAEWNSQFFGDRAFQISEPEKTNLRWEARQFRADKVWHRWDYPNQVGSPRFEENYPVMALYLTDNWRAFRTWGLSGNSPWDYSPYWKLREGVDKQRQNFKVDWENLQRPGFSPDYTDDRYERMDLTYERADWIATPAAQALLRNNRPLLAYLAGDVAHFTSKDHNFFPGDTVEKQLIVINNSRETVTAEGQWSFALPKAQAGNKKIKLPTGEQERIPLRFKLPAKLAPGRYELSASVRFSHGETQRDIFTVDVLPSPKAAVAPAKIALFDPKGETGAWLKQLGIHTQTVDANADLSAYDTLIVGKAALTVDGAAPDISRVREGLKVVMFEQTSDVLEKRFGFRVNEYGLRQVFPRVPDHPLLTGLSAGELRDWRGEATLLPSRLSYTMRERYGVTVQWCDLPVTRLWRCGNRGNVASVLIEKPATGDFLPIIDGGYSLQYSPLMEYREGKGMVLFCQLDVTGRSASEPAAEIFARNLFPYLAAWQPHARRQAVYAGDPAGQVHLAAIGVKAEAYDGGKLSPNQVLVLVPGCGQKLTGLTQAIADWLKTGGKILALRLDAGDVTALPGPVTLKKAEHIAAYFEAFGVHSPLAGVCPADVHNRDPRELPLVAGGAKVFGDGVLASSDDGNVIFCALAPWEFDGTKQANLKRTQRRASFLVTRLLANLGVAGATPVLERFHQSMETAKPEKRWLTGLYLDQPEEWDDPYRFFRW